MQAVAGAWVAMWEGVLTGAQQRLHLVHEPIVADRGTLHSLGNRVSHGRRCRCVVHVGRR